MVADLEKHPAPQPEGQGCVFAVVRIPVRIVAVVVVLPVRMLWDLLVLCARTTHRRVLRPVGEALARAGTRIHRYVLTPVGRAAAWLAKAVLYWPWAGLWRYVAVPVWSWVLVPVGRGLERVVAGFGRHVLAPLGRWIYACLLTPLGHALAWFLPRAFDAVFVRPWVGLWRYVVLPVGGAVWVRVLAPVGRGLVRLGRGAGRVVRWAAQAVFVRPGAGMWRYVVVPVGGVVWAYGLVPVARAVGWVAYGVYRYVLTPLGHLLLGAWQLAGRVGRAIGRGLLLLWRGLVARPAAWAYRQVATPVGHAVREVWRTARAAVRGTRASVRQALFGTPPREPARSRARSLGSTTAADAAPADEISLPLRRG